MDDSVEAVTAEVAAYRRRKKRIKSISKLAPVIRLLDEEHAIVSREYGSLCNVRRKAVVNCYILDTDYMLLEAACAVLFSWYVAAFELNSCRCASPKQSKTTYCTTP